MIKPFEVFNISKNKITTKYPCSITIDEREYDKNTFVETHSHYELPGVLDFYFPEFDDICNIVLIYPVNLIKTSNILHEKKEITIHYDKGETIIEKEYIPTSTDIRLLIKLFQGRVKYTKNPKIILTMLHEILPKVDLVHLEVIISNMYRKGNDESQKCRLTGKYDDAVILGVKKQPFVDSWKSALAFQYIDKAIQTGLLNERPLESNPIEQILSENFEDL